MVGNEEYVMFVGITSYKIHEDEKLLNLTKRCINVTNRQSSMTLVVDDSSKIPNDFFKNVHIANVSFKNVAKSLNLILEIAFEWMDLDSCVIINNDVILQPLCLERLSSYVKENPRLLFISAKEVCEHKNFPFSAFYMKKSLYEHIGKFDEGFSFSYVDTDYVLRMKEKRPKGAILFNCGEFPIHHETSSTTKLIQKNGELDERNRKDDLYLLEKWGLEPIISDGNLHRKGYFVDKSGNEFSLKF